MIWRSRDPVRPGPRNTSSPAARLAERQRAQAAGLARLEQEANSRREKSARLRKLREERDKAEKNEG